MHAWCRGHTGLMHVTATCNFASMLSSPSVFVARNVCCFAVSATGLPRGGPLGLPLHPCLQLSIQLSLPEGHSHLPHAWHGCREALLGSSCTACVRYKGGISRVISRFRPAVRAKGPPLISRAAVR